MRYLPSAPLVVLILALVLVLPLLTACGGKGY
jgi:hypothetical protein